MARDLRGFLKLLEERGQLRRIGALVDPDLEIAEISNRMLQQGGPGLLFENVKGSPFPIAINLMGTVERICRARLFPSLPTSSNSGRSPGFKYSAVDSSLSR